MTFVTTIIPVSSLSSHNKKNLDFICDRLKDYLKEDNKTVVVLRDESLNYQHDSAEVIKSSQIEIKSSFVMFLDSNIFFNFKEIKKVGLKDKVISPFSDCFHLNEYLTNEFFTNKNVSIDSGIKATTISLGSLCVMIKSELLPEKVLDAIAFGENEDWWLTGFVRDEFKVLGSTAICLYHDISFKKKRVKNSIVHAFNYACVDKKNRLYDDQIKSVDSYISNSKGKGISLINFNYGDCLRSKEILSVKLGRTAKSIGHNKDFPFLNDIFNMSMPYVKGNGWILYTNSDCAITNSLYDDILNFNGDYIELQRQEIDEKGIYLGSVRKGIDGIALRKSLLQKQRMPDLLIGAPYWDDVVSNVYSNVCDRKLIIRNQLIHRNHNVSYDLRNLDVAGEHNFKSFSNLLVKSKYNNTSRNKIRTQILVKVSTFGRPNMLFDCLDSFFNNMSGDNTLFFCVTCNNDDQTMNDKVVARIKSRYSNIEIYFGDYKSKIEAYNADIEKFDFDVLILASDDMKAIEKGYDQTILDLMNYNFPDYDGVLWFDTCDGNIITDTLSIFGKKYYERFGYAYRPDYLGYYCDDEFTQVAFKLGKLKRVEKSIVCHHLPEHLKMSEDNTYLRSLVHGTRDKALYKIRKSTQFDIPGVDEGIDKNFSVSFFQEKRNEHESPYWMISFPKFDDPVSSLELYILENMDRKISSTNTDNFLSFAKSYFRDFRWTIPPIIHQIWFGDIPPQVKEMMRTFSENYIQKNPGWRYVFWDETRLKSLSMINRDIFENESKFDCKSDIARLEILNKFGGIYVDSDCVWLGNKSFNSVPIKNGIMISYEKSGDYIGTGYLDDNTTRCANTVFGSSIANPIIAFIIGKLRDSYALNRKHGVVASTGPDFLQGVLSSLGDFVDINNHSYFYPIWWCVDHKKNSRWKDFLEQKNLKPEQLAKLYPQAVLFHKGYTSAAEGISP